MRLTVVEAIDVIVGDAASTPFSLRIAPSEIVGLLFPPATSRAPMLRALAGVAKPSSGAVVPSSKHTRIAIATPGPSLADALSSQPDLVLVDATDERLDHLPWVRLASERALGASFAIATANVDLACRCDRVALVSWDAAALSRAMENLVGQMASDVQEFLALVDDARHHRSSSLAVDLRRLNVGARALLAEMRRLARTREQQLAWQAASGQLAGVSVSERILEAAIANAQDR